MALRPRLARLEELAASTLSEPVDTSWTQHPAVVPILAELGAIPLQLPPPDPDPRRDSPNAIAAALGDPIHGEQVRKAFSRLAEVMCGPGADVPWIPTFVKGRR